MPLKNFKVFHLGSEDTERQNATHRHSFRRLRQFRVNKFEKPKPDLVKLVQLV